jgi:hypothetical protein
LIFWFHLLKCAVVKKWSNQSGGVKMKYVWRSLTGRCTRCGQRLNGHRPSDEVLEEINYRVSRLAGELGRTPRAQNCNKCSRIVFEGEPGFVKRYLLVDIV